MAHSLLHELLAPAPAPGGPRGGGARSYKITKEQVRLLLFKESDWRGRKLLFDSSTVEKVPIDKNVKNYTKLPTGSHAPCIVEVADGFAYQYKGPAPDAAILAEMMFGAVAMNYKGISLKIHILNEPQRLMCTKVFGVPIMPKMSCKERKSSRQMSGHSLRSAQSGSDVHKLSKPVDMPDFQLEEGVALSFSFDRGDSGFYSEHSPNSSVSSARDYCTMFESWGQENVHDDLYSFQTPPSGRKLSTTSNGSWQRRMFQNMSTRLDLNYQSSNLLTVPSVSSNPTSFDSHFYSNSTGSGTCDSLSSGSSASSSAQRKTKLGLALLITLTDSVEMEMFRYCVEHSPQLEALISRLRMAVMLSGIQRQDGPRFIATLVQATADALQWLIDLLNGPRLPPVWLNLVTAQHRAHHRIAESLLSDICTVLDHGDTKHTNFFISTLITHVLTYHLGWVTTVSPYDVSHELPTTAIYERSSYNALWAQLSDLCGSIGCPARAARTIVAGKNNKVFLNKVLTVLTYFIRCGDVRRNIYKYQNLADTLLSEINVTSVPITEIVKDSTCATKLEMKRTSTSGKLVNLAESSEILDNVAGEFYKSTVCSDIECKGSVNNNNYTSLKHSATTDMLPQVFAVDSLISRDSISSVVAKNERNISMTLDELKDEPIISCLKRAPTVMHSLISSDSTELYEGTDEIVRESKSVVFVLGDDDKLVGLKNKSCGGKSVKRSSKSMQYDTACANEMTITNEDKKREEITQLVQKSQSSENKFELSCDSDTKSDRSSVSPSRCCGQQSQHSKPIKHSGFKFEFDKYPQIVTNYMKSKNLEILDRHYIGKPGNLKLDNFQFDPTIVPPIQEERCENCYQCQLIESTLQTPTNASEFWSETNEDQAREGRPMLQYAHEEIVTEENCETIANLTPKTFMRKRKKNTVVINLPDPITLGVGLTDGTHGNIKERQSCSNAVSMEPPTKHLRVVNIEIPRDFAPNLNRKESLTGFHYSLLGGLTDHYVPDMILQGTVAAPSEWESDVRRDLDLMSHNNKSYENPLQAIAIVADSDQWEVRVLGNNGVAATGCGMSALVGTMLDALPHMRRAKVPAHECLSFVESKLREFCVLSKTLAEMLMSTDFCDMSTLTRSLNIDVNDVPLLLAVATTHTPQVAARYGISYR